MPSLNLLFPTTANRMQPCLLRPFSVEHVYSDFNTTLHRYLRNRTSDEDVYSNIIQNCVAELLLHSNTSKSVTIAIDGPASIAKIPIQLERRIKGHPNLALTEVGINSALLTPGSLLMHRIEGRIRSSIERFCTASSKTSLQQPPQVILSGHCTLGEAETKICKSIRSLSDLDSFLIYGQDSDLVLGALALPAKNLFIQNSNLQLGVFSKTEFLRELFRSVPFGIPTTTVHDFLFLSLLCGNDFVPGVADYTLKSIWPAYASFRKEFSHLRHVPFVDPLTFNLRGDLVQKFFRFAYVHPESEPSRDCGLFLSSVLSQLRHHFHHGEESNFYFGPPVTIAMLCNAPPFVSPDSSEHRNHADCQIKHPAISSIMLLSWNSLYLQHIPPPLESIAISYAASGKIGQSPTEGLTAYYQRLQSGLEQQLLQIDSAVAGGFPIFAKPEFRFHSLAPRFFADS